MKTRVGSWVVKFGISIAIGLGLFSLPVSALVPGPEAVQTARVLSATIGGRVQSAGSFVRLTGLAPAEASGLFLTLTSPRIREKFSGPDSKPAQLEQQLAIIIAQKGWKTSDMKQIVGYLESMDVATLTSATTDAAVTQDAVKSATAVSTSNPSVSGLPGPRTSNPHAVFEKYAQSVLGAEYPKDAEAAKLAVGKMKAQVAASVATAAFGAVSGNFAKLSVNAFLLDLISNQTRDGVRIKGMIGVLLDIAYNVTPSTVKDPAIAAKAPEGVIYWAMRNYLKVGGRAVDFKAAILEGELVEEGALNDRIIDGDWNVLYPGNTLSSELNQCYNGEKDWPRRGKGKSRWRQMENSPYVMAN